MKSKLLELMFQPERWEKLIDKLWAKDISPTELRELCSPETRLRLYHALITETIELPPCHMAQIPKDTPGEYRTVFVGETIERCLMSLINDCLFELFPEMVHHQCKSYRTGESCGKTVQELSQKMVKLERNFKDGDVIGLRFDFKAYFDNVSKEAIFNVFNIIEKKLGFEKGKSPVINFLRKTYASDLVFNLDNELIHQWMGIRQGNAMGSWLADVILYELDEFMSNKYKIYYRYSDDLIVLDSDLSEVIADINSIICRYGVRLNDKKTAELHKGEYFKFLGFNLCHDKITLSKGRVKKFTKEIYSRTIAKPDIHPNQAKKNVKRFLYGNGDNFSWATAAFSGLQNCDKDIETLNNFILDCLRLCEMRYDYNQERKRKGLKPRKIKYHWNDIGNIGVVMNNSDHTLIRGTGRKVATARERTQKEIDHYKSVGCLLNAYKTARPVYEAVVRGI